MPRPPRKQLLVLASTYPRWRGDHEPGFVHQLARRMTGKFDVTVLCPHAPGAKALETMDGVNVIRYRYAPERLERLVNDGGIVTNLRRHPWMLALVPGFVISQWWTARKFIRRSRPDVVHAHWLLPQGLIAATLVTWRRAAPPFVVTSHGADLFALRGRLFQSLKRMVAGRASEITVVSEAMRSEMARLGVAMERVHVEPMGVDLMRHFTPDASTPRAPREILFVGRLVEKKGVRYLLEAMARVLREEPATTLLIAGFGPEREKLEVHASSLGIENSVRFLGPVSQSQLPSLYRHARLLAVPFVEATSGDQEGLGLVAVEALGCGCPVVAGNVDATRIAFKGLTSVRLVDARDTQSLANAIIQTLRDPNKILSTDLIELKKRFSWTSRADAYSKLLEGAAARAQP